MRVVCLAVDVDRPRGTQRALLALAAALGARHDVEVWSVVSRVPTHEGRPPGVPVRVLVETAPEGPRTEAGLGIDPAAAPLLAAAASRYTVPEWEPALSGLTDLALERALAAAAPDVVLTTSPALLAVAVSLLEGGPTRVVHLERLPQRRRRHRLAALRAFGRRAAAIAVLNEPAAGFVREVIGAGHPEVVVVPDPLPDGFLPRSRGDSPLIVSACRLSHENNPRQLVRAFALVADRLPGWRLRFFGDGPQRQDVLAEARRVALFDRVELAGVTRDLRTELAKAGLAALAATEDGVPYFVTEAQAAGLPVVGYEGAGEVHHLVRDGVDGLLVPAGSETGLAAALLRLGRDQALRRSFGEAALRSAADRTPERVADRWEAVLGRLAEPRGPAGSPPAAPAAAAPGRWCSVPPRDALARVLGGAVAAARETAPGFFVLRGLAGGPPVVAVPAQHRRAFLGRLAEIGEPGLTVLPDPDGWPPVEVGGPLRQVAGQLQRGCPAVLRLAPPTQEHGRATLHSHGCQVDVEFWDALDGRLLAPRPNPWAVTVPERSEPAETDLLGVRVPTLGHAVGTTPHDRDFPVDVVYTWVDGADPEWQRRRDARLAQAGEMSRDRTASGAARFTSRDELRYSMRSVQLFAPWVRHLHVVTDGQVPSWLDTTHPMVTVVPHSEILPAEVLPTFNSHAIESALHRVPGLAEHFVYFNDDVLLGRPVTPAHFFSPSGQFAAFFGDHPVGVDEQTNLPYKQAALNNRRLIEDTHGRTLVRELAHTPHPFRRGFLADLDRRFPEEFRRTEAAPFRSETDISVTSSLAQNLGLLSGDAFEGELAKSIVQLGESRLATTLDAILETRHLDVLCLADSHDWSRPRSDTDLTVERFLDRYVPLPAPWENDRPR